MRGVRVDIGLKLVDQQTHDVLIGVLRVRD